MKNKYFYPIFKLKAKSWIRYWLLKKTEFKGKLSEILTGFSFNLENTLNRKFKIFEILGNSVQDGEPSPENEVPILSAGENGSITEKIVNKNLWSSVWEQGYINANGVNENNSDLIRTKDYIYFEPEQKYAIKRSIATAYTNVRGYDKNKRFIGTGSNVIVSYSGNVDNPMQATIQTCVIATKPGVYYLRFNDASNNLSTEYMMVKGDTPTDYVPHEEQTYSVYTQQPFRSIGDVRDIFFKNTVDSPYYDENLVENGWYERHLKWFRVTKDMIKGSGAYGVNSWVIGAPTLVKYIANTISCKCNYFRGVSHEDRTTAGNNIVYSIPSGTNIEFRNTEFSTRELFEAFLDDNEVYVEYIPVEPTLLPCTQAQIDILENLPKSYTGQTNVFSEDEVKAFLKIQYWESDTNG